MFRLIIDGEEAEMSASTKISLNRQILEISDLSKRGVKFTNSFVLPYTAKNNKLLGSPQLIATDNGAFEESKPYTLSNENTIVGQGRVIVRSHDQRKGTKIQLSEGVGLWDLLGSRKLNDLNLHDQDFKFTTANMNARKTRGDGVFLTALHDARGDKTNTALDNYTYTRPSYVLRNIIDRIGLDVGYSMNYGTVLSNTKMNLVGCLSNTKDFFVSDLKYRYQDISLDGQLTILSGSPLYNVGNNVTISGSALTNTAYKTAYVIKGVVSSKFNTSLSFTFSDRVERVVIPKGTTLINFKTDAVEIGGTVQISSDDPVTLDDVYVCSMVSEADIFDAEEAVTLEGMYVLADYNLPVITQKDLIKVMLKMFFLNVDTDRNKKILSFKELGGSINTNNFIDLTSKTVRNNSWESGKMYGKLNSLSYNNDDDVDADLGTAFFSVENENAKDTKKLIDIGEFSASKEVVVSGNRIVQAPIYDTVEPKRQSVSDRVVFFDEVGSFGFNATFSELSFQRLYSDHYFDFTNNTKRERIVEFEVNLNYSTFVALQESPLIYNSDLEGLFFATDIKGFSDDKLTKIQTVKYG